ncbi:hypothetical protein QQP08_003021 [Theobroma cacao]|uniref:Uncharacterized protein n=1 Tax=Theobroma cacao TaxID=3641 RepID=A0A061DPZ3_THECC|nr:Uncharacterized protein TCM_004095 [Theobroma cacao]WRX10534.1 hypothetical protein QQP08_003021 [Theobroma cacao]
MRRRELLEFRTPQHPSLGTNNWGGASPLLARDIPKESLEQRYTRLNSIRTRDEIFPTDGDFNHISHHNHAPKHEEAPKPSRRSRGFLSKLILLRKETVTLGTNSRRKRWLPRWDPRNRWPQGVEGSLKWPWHKIIRGLKSICIGLHVKLCSVEVLEYPRFPKQVPNVTAAISKHPLSLCLQIIISYGKAKSANHRRCSSRPWFMPVQLVLSIVARPTDESV